MDRLFYHISIKERETRVKLQHKTDKLDLKIKNEENRVAIQYLVGMKASKISLQEQIPSYEKPVIVF